ncbi:uncharacterized protein [Rutidosis leptorrhynchoides]|uniref:uncharacterized protein n=1 Tax=Rutidosis leptorrhynchoides TaxID=125765 RepID=UPI003A99FCEE
MSSEYAEAMRWHEDSRTKDGFMRHPADSPAWTTFDHKYTDFAMNPRNVRLGLASDGFNPIVNMSLSHSNNIDVYMQPLIDELKEFWDTNGVETYDSSTKTTFKMRAVLVWTISDFSVYANLSGWSTKGEFEIQPGCLTEEEVLYQLKGFDQIKFGKLVKNPPLPYNWKKRKKNVCESIVGMLMNIDGKTKDHLKSRRDLEEIKIRGDLHPVPLPNGKVYLPPACFSMDKNDKELFCQILRGDKVPDGYAANVSRYLGTLKSYVRNKSKPDGLIAKGYLADEFLAFCSLYLSSDVETIHNKKSRNYDDVGKEAVLPLFSMSGRPIGSTRCHYDIYIQCREHLKIVRDENPKLCKQQGFIVNGYCFHIKDVENKRKTQNSGVILEALTNSFSSTRDNNSITRDVTYYGVIKEIIELQCSVDQHNIVLFRYDWISTGSRKKVDENWFTLLNFVGLKPDKESFILASQAEQVFYVKDHVNNGWKVVIKTTPRDYFDMDEQTHVDVEAHLQSETSTGPENDEYIDMDIEMVWEI